MIQNETNGQRYKFQENVLPYNYVQISSIDAGNQNSKVKLVFIQYDSSGLYFESMSACTRQSMKLNKRDGKRKPGLDSVCLVLTCKKYQHRHFIQLTNRSI